MGAAWRAQGGEGSAMQMVLIPMRAANVQVRHRGCVTSVAAGENQPRTLDDCAATHHSHTQPLRVANMPHSITTRLRQGPPARLTAENSYFAHNLHSQYATCLATVKRLIYFDVTALIVCGLAGWRKAHFGPSGVNLYSSNQ